MLKVLKENMNIIRKEMEDIKKNQMDFLGMKYNIWNENVIWGD